MHIGLKIRAHPHHHIVENQGAAGVGLQAHHLLVGDAHLLGILRGHMNMPLGNNDALGKGNFPHLPTDFRSGSISNIPGLANRSGNAQNSGIGHGQFHLPGIPFRAKHRHIGKFPLRANHRHPFIGQILPRLGQRAFGGQGMPKQGNRLGLCHMGVPPGGLQFNKYPFQNRLGYCFKIQSIPP